MTDLIVRWNGRADPDSTGAIAYRAWKDQLGEPVRLSDRAGRTPPENVSDAIAGVRPWAVDAASSLEREPGQNFDVLALDAFSSDAIPVHLLTSEAFAVYLRHLRPEGILAVHVSNRYIDLDRTVVSRGVVKRQRLMADRPLAHGEVAEGE